MDARCPSGLLHFRRDEQGRIELACEKCERLLLRYRHELRGRKVLVLHYATDAGEVVETRVILSPRAGSRAPDRDGILLDPAILTEVLETTR